MCSMIGTLKIFYDLDGKTVDQRSHRKIYDRLKEEDRTDIRVRFWQYSK